MRLCHLLILVGTLFLFSVRLLLFSAKFRNNRALVESSVNYSRVQVVVSCIDTLTGTAQRPVKIIFVGDSRVRQQFYSFLAMLPDYDRIWDGQPNERIVSHYDMNVTSEILNLQVQFRWRHVISDALLSEIRHWATQEDPPRFILIGINVHHMFPENGADHRIYANQLSKLVEPLRLLLMSQQNTKLIWMLNQDTLDSAYFDHKVPQSFVYIDKVRRYNQLARHHLTSIIDMIEWNGAMVSEYIRSCWLNKRYGLSEYLNCYHWIHLGYVIIHENTQMLLNYLCNT